MCWSYNVSFRDSITTLGQRWPSVFHYIVPTLADYVSALRSHIMLGLRWSNSLDHRMVDELQNGYKIKPPRQRIKKKYTEVFEQLEDGLNLQKAI